MQNIKNQEHQSLSQQTIRISQILDQTEFDNLLEQSSLSSSFNNFLLQDIDQETKQNQQKPEQFIKNIHSSNFINQKGSLSHQKNDNSIKLCEKAYERTFINNKKLLDNQFFNFSSTKDMVNNKNQTDSDSEGDYLKQYKKWKDTQQTKDHKKICKQSDQMKRIRHKQNLKQDAIFFRKNWKQDTKRRKFDQIPDLKEDSIKNQFSLIEVQMKKIHNEYLSKIANITRKNISTQKELQDKKQYIPLESLKQTQTTYQQNLDKNIKENNQTTKNIKVIQENISQYCFQNMIKRKPTPIKNIKKEVKQSQSIKDIQVQINKKTNFQIGDQTNFDHNLSKTRNSQEKYEQTLQSTSRYLTNSLQLNFIIEKQTKIPTVRLNVQKLLSLGYKQFLIFFQQNHRKILTMTQPQDYKKLQSYQIKCLEHVESIQKLRQKFTSQKGAKLVQQLSLQQKQKLFRVLYE